MKTSVLAKKTDEICVNDFSVQTLKRSLTAFISLTYFYCLYELAKNVVRARPDFADTVETLRSTLTKDSCNASTPQVSTNEF